METSLWIEKRLLETNLHISNAQQAMRNPKNLSVLLLKGHTAQGAPTALPKKISLAKKAFPS